MTISDSERMSTGSGEGRDRSQSADRTIEVLLLLARRGPLRLADLIDTLGVPRRNVGRLLSSLEMAGLVRRDRQTLAYDLGFTLAWMGRLAEERVGLVRLSEPVIDSLMAETKLTSLLHVCQSDRLVAALVKTPRDRFSVNFPVAEQIPYWAGVGRIVLAYLPADEARGKIAKAPQAVDPTLLATFRDQGYAISKGEVIDGIQALGAPVFDPAGDVIAVVAVASMSEVESQADKVKAAAAEITRSLRR